ncbi:MAG TPA: DHA2 family efflux MFS transporter permease subunit [Candidatus Dormibacteraeota bacterium]|nr:DHA2 family efflux MFS transporter permease subunit [Candidatus Dormibacteraeota bacterium]
MRAAWRALLIEPRRPAAVRDSPLAHWLVVGTVCIGAFMGQLDASVVVLALHTLQHDFRASQGAVEWVVIAYLLVLVAAVTAVGRLADMVGRKLLYTYGFIVFIAGSAACGLAPSLPALIGARVAQALGAAMLQANSVALIRDAMPPRQLGRGIGVQGAAQAMGLALGPAIGGLLITIGGWRLIFLINVPAGLLGATLGWFLLPRTRGLQGGQSFDWQGAAVFVPAVGALLAAIAFGHTAGWTSPLILALFIAAVVGCAAFVVHERRASAPMIDLRLFRSLDFSAGISSGLLSYLVTFGTMLVVPYFLQDLGMSAARAGIALTVLPLVLGAVAPLAGRVADRVGARPVTVSGMALTALGLGALAIAHRSPSLFLGELAVVGAGLGAFTPANNAAIMAAAPRAQSGVAGGVVNMTRGLGTSLGVALTGLVYGAIADPARSFEVSAFFLAMVAGLAALLSALRGRTGSGHRPLDLAG